MIHIGKRIKEELVRQDKSACWFAEQIPCERSNVYHIFRRSDISVVLLMKISRILNHDFLAEMSEEMRKESGY